MRRVEEGFEEIVRSEPERVRALDATLPREELSKTVAQEILRVGGTGGSF
jgi:thymidylate kinase